jgi:hypothetical protein
MIMKKRRSANILVLSALILGAIGITVAFAAIQTTLNIQGTALFNTATWDVKFQNLSAPVLTGDATVATPPTLASTLIGTYAVVLTKPGDSVTYTFDVTNTGSLDAVIGTYTKATNPTCTGTGANAVADAALICGNLTYTLKYTSGGANVAQSDTLAAGQTKNLTLKIASGGSSLPTDDVNITDLGITIVYVEDN